MNFNNIKIGAIIELSLNKKGDTIYTLHTEKVHGRIARTAANRHIDNGAVVIDNR